METFRKLAMAFFVVMSCGSFIACGDDEEDGGGDGVDSAESILGEWTPVEDIYYYQQHGGFGGYRFNELSQSLSLRSITLKFKKDGTWEEYGTGELVLFDYSESVSFSVRGKYTVDYINHELIAAPTEWEIHYEDQNGTKDHKYTEVYTAKYTFNRTGNSLFIGKRVYTKI